MLPKLHSLLPSDLSGASHSALSLGTLQQELISQSELTCLHYACFCGRLDVCHRAVQLTGTLNCLFKLDKRGRSPVDLLPTRETTRTQVQVYTWGKTDDWQLGYLKDSQKTPRKLAFDDSKTASIASAVLCRHHSLFLTTSGEVYSCGEGGKGRLGLGPIASAFSPTKVPVQMQIASISASDGHCLAVR